MGCVEVGVVGVERGVDWGGGVAIGVIFVPEVIIFVGVMMVSVGVMVGCIGVKLVFVGVTSIVVGVERGGGRGVG